jgi:hypothetical protein
MKPTEEVLSFTASCRTDGWMKGDASSQKYAILSKSKPTAYDITMTSMITICLASSL